MISPDRVHEKDSVMNDVKFTPPPPHTSKVQRRVKKHVKELRNLHHMQLQSLYKYSKLFG